MFTRERALRRRPSLPRGDIWKSWAGTYNAISKELAREKEVLMPVFVKAATAVEARIACVWIQCSL